MTLNHEQCAQSTSPTASVTTKCTLAVTTAAAHNRPRKKALLPLCQRLTTTVSVNATNNPRLCNYVISPNSSNNNNVQLHQRKTKTADINRNTQKRVPFQTLMMSGRELERRGREDVMQLGYITWAPQIVNVIIQN